MSELVKEHERSGLRSIKIRLQCLIDSLEKTNRPAWDAYILPCWVGEVVAVQLNISVNRIGPLVRIGLFAVWKRSNLYGTVAWQSGALRHTGIPELCSKRFRVRTTVARNE